MKIPQAQDPLLGKFTFPVTDIARNGFIKDTWTLQDAEKGQIELALSWSTCYISETD